MLRLSFQNPEFYRAAMRMPVWDKLRVIGCAENFPNTSACLVGCLEAGNNCCGTRAFAATLGRMVGV
ncbi:MAG: hypothetical protein IPP44_00145 [Ideonella sp.]|nr:hypothetical protein [Ideonella sp.]